MRERSKEREIDKYKRERERITEWERDRERVIYIDILNNREREIKNEGKNTKI